MHYWQPHVATTPGVSRILSRKPRFPFQRIGPADTGADYYPQGSIDAYRENLKEDEDALERKFMQFAKQSGTFLIRQVNNSPGPAERLDWEVLKSDATAGRYFLCGMADFNHCR